MFAKSSNRILKTISGGIRQLHNMVRVVEVGPRDGLQNIKEIVPTSTKIELIQKLSETGLKTIESASFVSPKWVPQMADATEVMKGIVKKNGVDYPVLVPNLEGLEKAISVCANEVVLFVSASETFSRKNINVSIAESLDNCRKIQEVCQKLKIKTRGVISCAIACPYKGYIQPTEVAKVAEALLCMGCFEVALADTNGVATPAALSCLFHELKKVTGGDLWKFAVHCHDTYGQALANIYESLNQGIRVFDSSIAGLGGCPYAPGATGNVATEDLLYLLHGEGMETGVDLDKVIKVGEFLCQKLNVPNNSRVANVILAQQKQQQCANQR